MLESEELKEWKPNIILGLHIAPEYAVGQLQRKKDCYLPILQNYILI